MARNTSNYESHYDSHNLAGLIRSGWSLLNARRVRQRDELDRPRLALADLPHQLVFFLIFVCFAPLLDSFQRLHKAITGKPRAYPEGSWQFYLVSGLREDLAHHTNETTGYHSQRPADARELDDLTAWVMTLIQFLWSYHTLMGVVWDEWALLRLVGEAAHQAGLSQSPEYRGLQREWELTRPYDAPLNGSYADVRADAFQQFIAPRLAALPARQREFVENGLEAAQGERSSYQRQMSLLQHVVPERFTDQREEIPLWKACIGVIIGGRYYLVEVANHDDEGNPILFTQGGARESVRAIDNTLVNARGERLELRGDQVHRSSDGLWLGYLEMSPVAQVKAGLQMMMLQEGQEAWEREQPVDILLAETPRPAQRRLRALLPGRTQKAIRQLTRCPVLINWDARSRDTSLAELRRAQRGIGDHALTLIRTDGSFIFDQSHIFFDGTWSLAMAEVLTSSAVQWCRRVMAVQPTLSASPAPLRMEPSRQFVREARSRQQVPEISAETMVFDISQIFKLRKMLSESTGAGLTINDLLITTRIFHAAHYEPSSPVLSAIDEFRVNALTQQERRAVDAIQVSLERGRVTNPALLIPVDASPSSPMERIYPITFRNLLDGLVWSWDESWEAYQAYRRIEPPDTPEGIAAYERFAEKRRGLIDSLQNLSQVLDANKAVALRGQSVNIAILKLLVHLPEWLQWFVKGFAEMFIIVNEIARGDEVYSNVGRVAKGSSLSRFMSAKDDGNTKALVWGIMTDDQGRMVVTMRDFRPHVKPLIEAGRIDLARKMAQDYVVRYTENLIGLVARLWAMLQAEDPRGA